MPAAAPLSVVIPVLDAAAALPSCLEALAEARQNGLLREIIVVDGGSRDGSRDVAAAHGATVVRALPGRGLQLATGAAAADGDWLLFLHADTVPRPRWSGAAAAFLGDPANRERAAYFSLAFDDPSPAARRLERAVRLRCRILALPYGDQGLLIAAEFYRSLGGFRPLPLMEDVDLVRRIGRPRLRALAVTATTSAVRYRRDGYATRSLRNLACLSLYLLGVPSRLIRRLYA
jgi:rSAM/selenodomain-associated transferase 2